MGENNERDKLKKFPVLNFPFSILSAVKFWRMNVPWDKI